MGSSLRCTPTLLAVGAGGIGCSQTQEARGRVPSRSALRYRLEPCGKDLQALSGSAQIQRFPRSADKEGDKIDCVYCGTPDHARDRRAAALRAGKHTCCVKPLTRTIEEGRAVARKRDAGAATQITTSPATGETGCRVTELLAAGAIGQVREVRLGANGRLAARRADPPDLDRSDPRRVRLGRGSAAPKIPFRRQMAPATRRFRVCRRRTGGAAVFHPFNFRGWTAFGTGALGDMGCHWANIPYRALKLGR